MKRIFTIFLLVLSFESHSITIIDTSKTWTVLDCYTSGGLNCWPYQYRFGNDTVINSITYKPIGGLFLREDTITGEVFGLRGGFTQEWVLYDFNLNKGDTVFYCSDGGPLSNLMIVDSIDTIQYNGIDRKRILFDWQSGQFGTIWIEGIGSSTGIVHSFPIDCIIDGAAHLTCVDSAGIQIYQTPYYPICNVVLGVGDSPSPILYTISPNPFVDKIEVSFKDRNQSEVTIYNSFGQLVFEAILVDEENKIDLSHLESGIYFVVINHDGINSVSKLLKID